MERLTKRLASGNVCFYGNGTPTQNVMMLPKIMERLAAYEDAEEQGRLLIVELGQHPQLVKGSHHPKCFYTDKPANEFCLGFCCGYDDDEPIDACKECWWLDGNDDFRAGAEEALRKEQNNAKL